jgi:hypothetical protein
MDGNSQEQSTAETASPSAQLEFLRRIAEGMLGSTANGDSPEEVLNLLKDGLPGGPGGESDSHRVLSRALDVVVSLHRSGFKNMTAQEFDGAMGEIERESGLSILDEIDRTADSIKRALAGNMAPANAAEDIISSILTGDRREEGADS